MNKLTVAAVALAAGVTCFAPISMARSGDNAPMPPGPPAKTDLPGVDTTTTGAISPTDAAGKKKAAAITNGQFSQIISKYATEHGVPASLAYAVIQVESNFRPNVTGRAGEVGLMQIKPATARMMGYSGSAKGLYDPEVNIRYGMKYLAMAQSVGDGTTCGTILKYNAGHAAKRMNPISANYCAKVQRIIGGA